VVFCLKRSSFTEYIEHETQHELASTLSWIAFEGRSWKILHGTGSVVSIKLHVCLCVFLFRVYQKEKSVCSSSFNLDLLPPDRAFIPRWILLCSCSPLDVLVSFAVHLSGNSWCFWREVTWSFFCPQTQSVKNNSGRNARRLVVAAKDCCCTGHSWPGATAVIECRTSKHSTDLYDLCLSVFNCVS